MRICKRDGFQEWRFHHDWCDWEYVSDGSCQQIRICKRDGSQEERLWHNWREEYSKDEAERGEYDIRRFDDTLLIPHDEYWGETHTDSVWRCTRCGAIRKD
jgi:hypothetical protein